MQWVLSFLQALFWAWSHALPVSLQRPRGDAARLPSAAPGSIPPAQQLAADSVDSSSEKLSASCAAEAECSARSAKEGKSAEASGEMSEGGVRTDSAEDSCSGGAAPKKVSFLGELRRRSFDRQSKPMQQASNIVACPAAFLVCHGHI